MPPARGSNRLNDRSMHLVPPAVRRPAYDRAQLRISMAHVGVGAFHRCHQAEHTEDAIEAGSTECGVVGINLRPTLLVPSLGLQDGLYSRTLREGDMRRLGASAALAKGRRGRDAERAVCSARIADLGHDDDHHGEGLLSGRSASGCDPRPASRNRRPRPSACSPPLSIGAQRRTVRALRSSVVAWGKGLVWDIN
jgi:hypothetical protein